MTVTTVVAIGSMEAPDLLSADHVVSWERLLYFLTNSNTTGHCWTAAAAGRGRLTWKKEPGRSLIKRSCSCLLGEGDYKRGCSLGSNDGKFDSLEKSKLRRFG